MGISKVSRAKSARYGIVHACRFTKRERKREVSRCFEIRRSDATLQYLAFHRHSSILSSIFDPLTTIRRMFFFSFLCFVFPFPIFAPMILPVFAKIYFVVATGTYLVDDFESICRSKFASVRVCVCACVYKYQKLHR